MQKNTLQWKRVTLMTLLCLLFITGWATEDLDRAHPDFSAVCPSGQTLHYKITDATNHYVTMTYPGNTYNNPWDGNFPTGPIALPETVTYNGAVYTVTAIDNYTFRICYGLTGDLVIPNTITKIGNDAFSDCTGLNGTLTIGNSVQQIGNKAFMNCCNLTGSLVLPNSVQTIGTSAFQECIGLTGTLVLSESLTTIGQSAFALCGFTGPLYLPNSITDIKTWAFDECKGFTGDLILPRGLQEIKGRAFRECSGLNGIVVIPNGVTNIGQYAFEGCNNIQAIYVCTETPPTCSLQNNLFTPFNGMNANIPIYVPYCSTELYSSAAGWSFFSDFQGRSFFVTDGDWSTSSNWTCGIPAEDQHAVLVGDCAMDDVATIGSLTIFKDYVLSIQPDAALTVSNTITNYGNAANLIIEDGGQFRHQQNGVLATVKKSINAYDTNDGWYLISSPLASSIAVTSVENLLSNNYDLYYYDEPTYYWINQELASNNFTELESGKGYLYANSEDVALGFAGALKNGTETVTVTPLSYAGAYLQGFNLIGNPYAHNITSLTTVDVEEGCYRMNGTLDDLMVSEVSANEPLKPTEGIFVKATSTNASVTFNPNNTRTEIEKTGNICIEVMENGKIADRLLVKRNEGNDFQKLSLRDNRTKVFATRDNEELAIVVCNDDEQTVNFKTAKNGTYTISVTLQNVEADYLHLIDNLTGNDVDLLATPTYSFEAKTTDYASRFRLVFSPEAIENGSNESFAFIANDEFIIANEGIATLQVIDLTGRILSTETINGSFNKPINMSKGVYMLRLINGNDVKTQKIVVE